MFGAGPFIHTEDAISIPAYFHVPFENHDANFLLVPCSHYRVPVTSAAFLPESLVRRITKLILPN